jgi:phosphoglycolate phosphatase
MNKKKLIIFDLDGVLINSLKNMELSLKQTNKKLGLNLNFSEYKQFLGLPFEKIMNKIGIKKQINIIKKNYIFYSNKNLNKLIITKKNIKDLKSLKKNYICTVFTSKDKYRTNKILKKYKLFDYILTSDDVKKGKPNSEGVLKILKKFKIRKKNSIYVGDSIYDYKCSVNASIKYCHATWGYDKMNSFKKLNRIKNFKEILNFF